MYEDLPKICTFFYLVGYTISKCREAHKQAESIIPPEKKGRDQPRSSDHHEVRSRSRRRKGKIHVVQTRQEHMPVVRASGSTSIATMCRVVPMGSNSETHVGKTISGLVSNCTTVMPPLTDLISNALVMDYGLVLSTVGTVVNVSGYRFSFQYVSCSLPVTVQEFSSPIYVPKVPLDQSLSVHRRSFWHIDHLVDEPTD